MGRYRVEAHQGWVWTGRALEGGKRRVWAVGEEGRRGRDRSGVERQYGGCQERPLTGQAHILLVLLRGLTIV